jgi:cobalamin biosynthesis protein CobT
MEIKAPSESFEISFPDAAEKKALLTEFYDLRSKSHRLPDLVKRKGSSVSENRSVRSPTREKLESMKAAEPLKEDGDAASKQDSKGMKITITSADAGNKAKSPDKSREKAEGEKAQKEKEKIEKERREKDEAAAKAKKEKEKQKEKEKDKHKDEGIMEKVALLVGVKKKKKKRCSCFCSK